MSDRNARTIDEKIQEAARVPDPSPEFLARLRHTLAVEAAGMSTARPRPRPFFQPAWRLAAVFFILLAIVFAVVGPQKVIAAVGSLFGYIPDVGIVNQSAPIRVLEAPVSVTRDGITVAVTRAILTADKTSLQVEVAGVPRSAYPDREDTPGCLSPLYLRLADGSRLEGYQDFQALPASVNQATLLIPCIANTLPGKAPENWELALRFVPAPPEMTVMPVISVASPAAPAQTGAETLVAATELPQTSTVSATQPGRVDDGSLTVDQVIETPDGYILLGRFEPKVIAGGWVQGNMAGPQISDANGKKVVTSFPRDINPPNTSSGSGYGWAVQFQGSGLAFPLTLSISGTTVTQADPGAKAEFEFDAGPDPQPGQTWKPGVEIQLAGHTLRVTEISVDSRNGYGFSFESDPQVYSASVEIAGYNAAGGGGGGGAEPGKFSVSQAFKEIPKGKLTVFVSNLTVVGDNQTWTGHWQPASPRSDWPTATPRPATLCLDPNTQIDQLPVWPVERLGKAMQYETIPGGDTWGITLANLDGSQKQTLAANENWAALSADGQRAAFPEGGGIKIVDLGSGNSTLLSGADGYNLRWSPDGARIAFAGGSSLTGVYVVEVSGGSPRQLTRQGYEEIAGWSADGSLLYYAARDIGGWRLHSVRVDTGEDQSLFLLADASVKAPGSAVSPDGKWVVYRDQNLNSLYLAQIDGSETHRLVDRLGNGIGFPVWSQDSRWLGIGLVMNNSDATTTLLVEPGTCQAYHLPEMHGYLQGLFVPAQR